MTSGEITLFDALDTCIAGIRSRFGGDWFICDADGEGLSRESSAFSNNHFSKVFKKETGFTPTQFRRLYGIKNR